MKGTSIFNINGKNMELPLFEKGDRVYIPDNENTASERVEGTVISTSVGGLFVDVDWDKNRYNLHPSVGNGTVEIGKGRMVNGIKLIEEEGK